MIESLQVLLLYLSKAKRYIATSYIDNYRPISVISIIELFIDQAVNRYVSKAIGNTTKPLDPKPKTAKRYYKIPYTQAISPSLLPPIAGNL